MHKHANQKNKKEEEKRVNGLQEISLCANYLCNGDENNRTSFNLFMHERLLENLQEIGWGYN